MVVRRVNPMLMALPAHPLTRYVRLVLLGGA